MRLLGDYCVGEAIGTGSYASVHFGERVSDSCKVAMKMIDKSRSTDSIVQREISNQERLDHQNVIKLEDILETDDTFCLVQEYAAGGDLTDYILSAGRVEEDKARSIFRQLVAGVSHCHEHMVVHRDVKPDNILFDDDLNVKLVDFGISSQWRPGSLLTDSCGSPDYAAPELLSEGCSYEGPEVDVWSCGVVLYTMLCGHLPFDADTIPEVFKKVKKGEFTTPAEISDQAKDLLARMLCVDPAKRTRMADVQEHPWLLHVVDELVPAVFEVEAACSAIDDVALALPFAAAVDPFTSSRPAETNETSFAATPIIVEENIKAETLLGSKPLSSAPPLYPLCYSELLHQSCSATCAGNKWEAESCNVCASF